MLKDILRLLGMGRDLTEEQAATAMDAIISGEATPAQIGALLASLRLKGETAQEVTGMAKAMSRGALRISPRSGDLVDTCGTGGDGLGTFNISTTAAFIVAACGARVAKHGNRSASGRVGSADVLEALGVRVDLTPTAVEECIDSVGIGFLFAPLLHPGARHAAGPRKELGYPTVFNVLGPLVNPAGAGIRLVGVGRPNLGPLMAQAMHTLGIARGMVVHGSDGMDEVTLTGTTTVWHVAHAGVSQGTLVPGDFGLDPCEPQELAGGDALENSAITTSILMGSETGAKLRVAVANASCALVLAGAARDHAEGTEMALEAVRSGKSMAVLEALRTKTRALAGEVAV